MADGARSHLFYTGRDFKNFELEVEALAQTACNSGVYFHTAYQETGFPTKGFEVQINNTAGGEGTYRERKKTGSLYGLRNVYKQFIDDGQWFKMHVLVRGKNVQVRLDGMLVVDYTEPTPPVIPPGPETGRFLDHGTFALQGHNPGSVARFRSIRVRPLADDATAPGAVAPVVDATFRKLIDVGRNNYPVVDYHVHLKLGLTLEQALAQVAARRHRVRDRGQLRQGIPHRERRRGDRVLREHEGAAVLHRHAGRGTRVDADDHAQGGGAVRLHLHGFDDVDGPPRQAHADLDGR